MRRVIFLAAALFAALAGCSSSGPQLAEVTGVARLDGAPLPNALLLFIPENGRTSFGKTDSAGSYRLYYTDSKMGAIPGQHVVRISTRLKADAASGTAGAPELLPAKYNTRSELTRSVQAGTNIIDFDLTAQGFKSAQPND